MEEVLKDVSLISVAGAGISLVVGVWNYVDQRALEERTKRFELYRDLMRRVSAFDKGEGAALPLTQQVAAIYELQHFEDYKYASVPILEHLREVYGERNAPPAPPVLLAAIEKTLQALKG